MNSISIKTFLWFFTVSILLTGTLYPQPSNAQTGSGTYNTPTDSYSRNSLSIMLLDVTSREYAAEIKNAFLRQAIPGKFDDHNVPLRAIPVYYNPAKDEDLGFRLERYLNTECQVGKMMVAKWFNRDEYGRFNMATVANRGKYNATDLDVKQALASKTGLAKIEDAGEKLIDNSYVAVYSFRIFNKENTAKAVGAGLKILGSIADAYGYGNAATLMKVGGTVTENVRGFTCSIDVYLFKLDWSPQVSNTFYEKYWIDDANYDIDKAQAFENDNLFRVKYISKSTSMADVTGITVDGKENENRIADLMTKTLPNGLKAIEGGKTVMAAQQSAVLAAALANQANVTNQQAAYMAANSFGVSAFKVKARVAATEPHITAKIGLKEGLKKNDLYLVYEKTENSVFPPKPVASVRVKNTIWDNRYNADGKADTSNLTRFYSYYGRKPYQGLILEQKTQNKAYWSFNFGGLTRSFILGSRFDFGHSFRFGIGVHYISDKFFVAYDGAGVFSPYYFEMSTQSTIPYIQIAQYINVGRGWYFEPFASLGLHSITFQNKFFSLNNAGTGYEEFDFMVSEEELPYADQVAFYADFGLRFGVNISPTGTSLFTEAALAPTMNYELFENDTAVEYGSAKYSGNSIVNLNVGIRFKL